MSHRAVLTPARAAVLLAIVLTGTGTLHFVAPSGFRGIVPAALGSPAFWVAASGVAELACAAALAVPATRRIGGWATAVLFVLVFPANIQMAVDASQSPVDTSSLVVALARLPLQVPLVLWALYVATRSPR